MVTREEVIEELKMPDEHLEEVYRIIKTLETNGTREEAGESVMSQLRKIRISASADLAIRAKLHDLEARMSSSIFVDTSFVIALINSSDQYHNQAQHLSYKPR